MFGLSSVPITINPAGKDLDMLPKFAVLDTETTGFRAKSDRVIEIAVVLVGPSGAVEGTWDTLINPHRDTGPTHIHGITNADVSDAPHFEDIAGDLIGLLRGRVLVCHNASFDAGFLVEELARAGAGLSLTGRDCLCTMKLSRALVTARHHTLKDCRERAGIEQTFEHHALADAISTARLLDWLAIKSGGYAALNDKLRLDKRAARVAWPQMIPRGSRRKSRAAGF